MLKNAQAGAWMNMRSFSLEMRTKHRKLYHAITGHPLVSGMAGATLRMPVFRNYILQDYLYLKSYTESLRILAARSTREAERKMLHRHLRGSAAAEFALQDSFFPLLEISRAMLEAAQPLPACAQNAQVLKETSLSAPIHSALAAIIPCYRGYLEMGREVASHRPDHLIYSKWAALYASPEYEADVLEIERAADARAAAETELDMEAFYIRGCRLEVGFLDAVCRVADNNGGNK